MAAMRVRTSSSVAVMPEPRRFGQRRLFLDHLLDDPLVDAELFQHALVDVAAELRAIGLHLLLVDRRNRPTVISRPSTDATTSLLPAPVLGLEEAGNVEKDECQDHNGQAPFEPALVSAHPVEHRHGFGGLFGIWKP